MNKLERAAMQQAYLLDVFDYADGKLFKRDGQSVGSVNGNGYEVIWVEGKKMQVHRAVFLMHHGYLPDSVDHIDGNKLNNRVENLRDATLSQNQHNSKLRKDNKSGIKGVHWYKQTQKWKVELKVNGKTKHIGCFKELGDAKNAIEEARKQYHGEFANHG